MRVTQKASPVSPATVRETPFRATLPFSAM